MAEAFTLTGANIRYLLTMRALDSDNRGIRCVSIAAALGKSKPSVHNMMNTLAAYGFVKKEAYGLAALTAAGEEMACRYSRYYEAACRLLQAALPDDGELQTAAYALIAALPEDTLERLCRGSQEKGEKQYANC